MLRDLRAGDTEDMDRERAEAYLRALAEAELRRAIAQPSGDARRAGHTDRMKKVAQVLVFVGALGDGVAEQILDQFEFVLGAPAKRSDRLGSGVVQPASSGARPAGETVQRPARGGCYAGG